MSYGRTEGDRLRDTGMRRVEAAESERSPGWNEMALEEIHWWAIRQEYFTPDDVRIFIKAEPVKPQAWGAVWKKALSLKWIEPAPEKGRPKSFFPSQHSHRVDYYHSLIFQG